MAIIDATICMAILIIGIVVAVIPCAIMYFTLKAVINWIKWFIKVHRDFDDDWYDL